MGQQQLILLVLATVIVGVAIVIGVRAFTENSVKNNYDALVHDAMRMASDANAWKQKPVSFGGQAAANKGAGDWTNLSFDDIGYTTTSGSTCIFNENGWFQVTAAGAAAGSITGFNEANGNKVEIDLPTSTTAAPVLDGAASVRGTATDTQPTTCDEAAQFTRSSTSN